MSDFNEPWKLVGESGKPIITDADCGIIADWCVGTAACEEMGDFIDQEYAARIVACVNFCAGIPTEELEGGSGALLGILAEAKEVITKDAHRAIKMERYSP
jgi:hypothetical protein